MFLNLRSTSLLRVDAFKLALLAVVGVRQWHKLKIFYGAPRDSALGRLTVQRPEVFGMVLTPFVNSNWNARTRLERVIDHCTVADRLGGPFVWEHDDYYVVTRLHAIGSEYYLVLDSPRWLFREGLMSLSLWEDDKRIFSISFTLSEANGELIAFVGGLQGTRIDGIAERYQRFTKASFGIRPRDFIVTAFGMMCRAIGVQKALAVADSHRHQLSSYSLARARGQDPVDQKYDQVWAERGGVAQDDGFYSLPLNWHRRDPEAVPRNKRGQYRRRYEMLDELEEQVRAAFAPAREWQRLRFDPLPRPRWRQRVTSLLQERPFRA